MYYARLLVISLGINIIKCSERLKAPKKITTHEHLMRQTDYCLIKEIERSTSRVISARAKIDYNVRGPIGISKSQIQAHLTACAFLGEKNPEQLAVADRARFDKAKKLLAGFDRLCKDISWPNYKVLLSPVVYRTFLVVYGLSEPS